MNLSDCATIIEQMADNGLIDSYELSNTHNQNHWNPKYILTNSKENKTFEFNEKDISQLKDEVELINFLHNGIGSGMRVKPNISNNSSIFCPSSKSAMPVLLAYIILPLL